MNIIPTYRVLDQQARSLLCDKSPNRVCFSCQDVVENENISSVVQLLVLGRLC